MGARPGTIRILRYGAIVLAAALAVSLTDELGVAVALLVGAVVAVVGELIVGAIVAGR